MAWRCIGEAMKAAEITKEKWCETEVLRVTGEITLKSPEPDPAKAQAYFESALAVARAQQAKSSELRATMSLARLWRDQGKREEAHDLLAPIYGWFTEGFRNCSDFAAVQEYVGSSSKTYGGCTGRSANEGRPGMAQTHHMTALDPSRTGGQKNDAAQKRVVDSRNGD
jgi:hypothetical protein